MHTASAKSTEQTERETKLRDVDMHQIQQQGWQKEEMGRSEWLHYV